MMTRSSIKKKRSYGRILPDEIIREILPRLPGKVLFPWILVCKNWFHMFTSDLSFIDRHRRLSRPTLIFDVPLVGHFEVDLILNDQVMTTTSTSNCVPTFTFKEIFAGKPNWRTSNDPYNTLIVGTWDGLLCVYSFNGILDEYGTFYIVNPATRQWVSLPRCHLKDPFSYRFGYDPSSSKCKLVCFSPRSDDGDMYNPRCQILTVGSRTWREIECPLEPTITADPPIVLGKFLHWNPMSDGIYSLDISCEKFRKISIPFGSIHKHYLFKIDGSLALGCGDFETNNNSYVIWILEDYNREIWTKKYSITLDVYILPKSFIEDYYPVASLNNGEIIFFKELIGLQLFCYEPKCKRFREIKTNWEGPSHPIKVLDYVSTLISPTALTA